MRTTAIEVKQIIETDLSEGIVNAFIGDANLFVTNHLSDSELNEATLTSIEKWISAHLIAATRERQAKSEGAGGASITYIGNFTEGLNGTMYGQQAITLDTSGILLSISLGKKKINMEAL